MTTKRENRDKIAEGRRLAGALLQLAWILLLLALVSYAYTDLPFFQDGQPDGAPTANWLGRAGAYAACGAFSLFGVAAFLLPAALAALGWILWYSPSRASRRAWWLLGMMVAAAVLADLNPDMFADTVRTKLNLVGTPGGCVGWLVGQKLMQTLLGRLGTGICAIAVLAAGVFFVTRTTPAELWKGWRELWQNIRQSAARRRDERDRDALHEQRRLERAQKERNRTQRAVQKQHDRLQRQDRKQREIALRDARRRREELEREERQRRETEQREERLRRREEARERLAAERERERLNKELERERLQTEREKLRLEQLKEQSAQREAQIREREEREAKRKAEEERRLKEAEEQQRLEEEQRAEQQRLFEEQRQAEELRRQQEMEAAKQRREALERERKQREAQRAALAASQPQTLWELPPIDLLQEVPAGARDQTAEATEEQTKRLIEHTLERFGIEAGVIHTEHGPTVTLYEVLPAPDVKVERIAALHRNLALALKAESVRIQAPVPGKGVVGIEVPRKQPMPVVLRQLLESPEWITTKASLPLAIGLDVQGEVLMADLAKLPHLLIAGATGMGKTVCMNSLLASLLMTRTPDELKLILVDPKIVEFSGYNGLPHLITPVITEPKKVEAGLKWSIKEMEKRFHLFQRAGVRDIKGYNARPIEPKTPPPAEVQDEQDAQDLQDAQDGRDLQGAQEPAVAEEAVPAMPSLADYAEAMPLDEAGQEVPDVPAVPDAPAPDDAPADTEEAEPEVLDDDADFAEVGEEDEEDGEDSGTEEGEEEPPLPDRLPYIVIIVDELADLMLSAQAEIEPLIQRITQLARATGIHLIVATQTPRVKVITGTIKSNIPGRISFKVAAQIDSRVILDRDGADKLMPRGDMLMLPGTDKLIRAQGAWTKDEEIQAIAEFWKKQGKPVYDEKLQTQMSEKSTGGMGGGEGGDDEVDAELIRQALDVICATHRASASAMQRRLKIGYTRAARVMDVLEERGYIGPTNGAKPREILFDISAGPPDLGDDF